MPISQGDIDSEGDRSESRIEMRQRETEGQVPWLREKESGSSQILFN